MLWKPATPVYPKLIQEAPEGLTKEEADEIRRKGRDLLPICNLGMNLLVAWFFFHAKVQIPGPVQTLISLW
jgi:hypothetical protein